MAELLQKDKEEVIYIGTSNVVVPGNKQSFQPAFRHTSRLRYYSSLFNTVEVNRSFYKMPLHSTFERWREEVGPEFRFSIKLNKEFTHTKDMRSDTSRIDSFLQAADGLAEKKGCLLIQFPGKITLDFFSKVENLIDAVNGSGYRDGWRPVIEFRHPSWYIGETMEMLKNHGASLVLHDMPKSKWFQIADHASVVYVRLHGPAGDYRGGYGPSFLKDLAGEVRNWLHDRKQVYLYFNNTIGDAFRDAEMLRDLLHIE